MFKFDFIVDDIDAGNIFDCINSEIQKMHVNIFKCTVEIIEKLSESENANIPSPLNEEKIKILKEEKDWFNGHIKYLKELMEKMTNKRVGE